MRAALVAAMAVTLALALGTSAQATTITVDSLADVGSPGICVLRDAITAANTMTATNGCAAGDGDDTIQFNVTGTILLASTLPGVTDTQLTINGPAVSGVTIDGRNQVRVMRVAFGATLHLAHLTISHGFISGCCGGGIFNNGTLTITNSTVSDNHTGSGGGGGIENQRALTITNSSIFHNHAGAGAGGIFNDGTLTITNSTFSGNSAPLGGGGIADFGRMVTITNSTFSGNSADEDGGAIFSDGRVTITNSTINSTISGNSSAIDQSLGTMYLKSTIIADSATPSINCSGRIIDAGYNISDDSSCNFSATGSQNNTDPMLDPGGLNNNGGPTQTIALRSGSPAIDTIPVANCTDQAAPPNPIITDQRLFPRPDSEESLCDIGAYEFADSPFIPFARFSGSLTIDSNTRVLNLNGSFKLGVGGSIDPSTQPVAFSVGQHALRLPVGSFVQNAIGYVYQARIGRSFLSVTIEFTNTPGSYRLLVFQQRGPQFTSPVPVTLTIGNDSGSTQMNVKFD